MKSTPRSSETSRRSATALSVMIYFVLGVHAGTRAKVPRLRRAQEFDPNEALPASLSARPLILKQLTRSFWNFCHLIAYCRTLTPSWLSLAISSIIAPCWFPSAKTVPTSTYCPTSIAESRPRRRSWRAYSSSTSTVRAIPSVGRFPDQVGFYKAETLARVLHLLPHRLQQSRWAHSEARLLHGLLRLQQVQRQVQPVSNDECKVDFTPLFKQLRKLSYVCKRKDKPNKVYIWHYFVRLNN